MTGYHLGIYMGHDTGVAIVDGDLNLLYVFEEERFNGEKMTYFNPYFSLREIPGLRIRHFRTISFGFDPHEKEKKFLQKFLQFQQVRCAEVLNYLSRNLSWDEVCFVGHHDCHAAGAFFCSGFHRAAVLVADGTGESESTSFYLGEGNTVSRASAELTRDFSLGILYQYFTEWLGYRSPTTAQHCGKIMGLSSYGSPVYKERIREILERDGGQYKWPRGSLAEMRREIVKVFGVPQPRPTKEFNTLQADVASSIQSLLEDMVLEKLRKAKEAHPFDNLCFSGGVGMNSLLNYRILKSGVCENLFVQPLASDRGIAMGAALASAGRNHRSRPGISRRQIPTLYVGYGKDPLRRELGRVLDAYDLPVYIEKEFASSQEIARLLDENQILAIFQGRQEIGPRALGNRSIVAAPTVRSRDKTNGRVKYREPWRPFAPTVLEEEVTRYFDMDRPEPFMTAIYGVLPGMISGIEGVTHVDGTARLQTVSRDQNPLFHEIIAEYQKITGIPIILNTSFNIYGQPIVRTVYDAVVTFLCSGIDGLLMEHTLVRKRRSLPRENVNRLDRILSEATRNAKSIVIKVLDFSDETETLLQELLDCPCIRFRRDYAPKPISRCYIGAHTKMSWRIIAKVAAYVDTLIYGQGEKVTVRDGEICIMVLGDRLIEASSRPRSYVGFDRGVCKEIIEQYFQMPNSDRYFILDREFHLFDMDYLHSRFESSWAAYEDRYARGNEGEEPHEPFSEAQP
jgi:carbamoyltransferase